MLDAELADVCLVEEEDVGVFFGDGGGGVGAIVEDGNFADGRSCAYRRA